MVVLEPDLLLSPSKISTSTRCARKFVLKTDGRDGLSLPNEAMTLGNLKHDLFERLIVGRASGDLALESPKGRKALVDAVVAESVVDRCAIDMTDQKARGKLMEALQIMWRWT